VTREEDGLRFIEFQVCSVGPGRRELFLTGAMSATTRQSVGLLMNLVMEHARPLDRLFGVPAQKGPISAHLFARPYQDLHVHIVNWWLPFEPAYQQAALYVALVSLVMRRRPRPDTAILGDVNNIGGLSSTWDYSEAAVLFCHHRGIRRLVLAEGTVLTPRAKVAAEDVMEDGRPRVEIFFRDLMLEAVPLLFDGLVSLEQV
jgi:hypothetical protein